MTPTLLEHKNMWTNYDEEAGVLYIEFEKPSCADDSEITDDDIIIRYKGDLVVGITVLYAKKRQ